MSTSNEAAAPISGGCLCGKVRYTVTFPAGCAYPPEPFTCQCIQCRKNTGALVAHFISLVPSQITWAEPNPNESTTFREYSSSPNCYRGFCERCGTTLTWRSEKQAKIEVMAGTIDDKFLMERSELSAPTHGQFWCRNYIHGVTDTIPNHGGPRWVEGSALGQKLE